MAEQATQVGTAFIQHYYTTFDSNTANLVALYQAQSVLTFEGSKHVGQQAILEKLQGVAGSAKVSHAVRTLDVQPSAGGGLLVFVTGQLSIDGAPGMNYNQVFQLMPAGSSFYVLNDIFRLNIG